MRILTFSTLYPNVVQPRHGIFVEERLRHLLATNQVRSRVMAPVPWFPWSHRLFGRYGALAQVPPMEERHGIVVEHPRYPLLPKVGMTLAPLLLAAASYRPVRHLLETTFPFELIDAHYAYPDGVAAMLLGRLLDKPVTITGRGTDLNLIPQYRLPRRLIQWAARESAAMITVCQALADPLLAMGIPADKITVLRNGVNLERFHPLGRAASRQRLHLEPSVPYLLSVGHLIERKGHDLAIRALPAMAEARLLIVGDGELLETLRQLATTLGVLDRVTFCGALPQDQLSLYYSAANLLILASSREGWANVLLESLACGTPVVATALWGTPEVIQPEVGALIHERTPEALVTACRAVLARAIPEATIRGYAETFSWDATSQGQLALFKRILQR